MKTALLLIVALLCTPALGAGKLRDPTRPLAAKAHGTTVSSAAVSATPAALPALQMVLVGAGRRLAVIDGEVLSIGDEIRGLTLLQIHDESVVLNTAHGPRTLPLALPPEP